MSYSKRNQDRWEKHQQLRKYSKDDTILMAESEEELEIKLPTFTGLQTKKENFRKTSISVSLTTLKSLCGS